MSISRLRMTCADRRCRGRGRRTSTARACRGRCPATSSGCPAGPCRRTGRGGPSRRRRTARFSVVVVFATPPFWLANAMTLALASMPGLFARERRFPPSIGLGWVRFTGMTPPSTASAETRCGAGTPTSDRSPGASRWAPGAGGRSPAARRPRRTWRAARRRSRSSSAGRAGRGSTGRPARSRRATAWCTASTRGRTRSWPGTAGSTSWRSASGRRAARTRGCRGPACCACRRPGSRRPAGRTRGRARSRPGRWRSARLLPGPSGSSRSTASRPSASTTAPAI